MAGLKGVIREPRESARARRNSQNLGDNVEFVGAGSVVYLDGSGVLQLRLASAGGLENSSGELQIALATDPGLEFDGGELRVKADPPVMRTASGVGLSLDTDPGLEVDSNNLRVKIKAAGGVTRDSDGLSLTAAGTSQIGGVQQAAARADSGQDTVGLSSVTTSVTDPADAPANADALRDDLVANALAEIEAALGNLSTRDGELKTAIETLATEFNDLLAKLRTAGVLNP